MANRSKWLDECQQAADQFAESQQALDRPQFEKDILPDVYPISPHPSHLSFGSQHHLVDGKPAGGESQGIGISIHWQNGPLGRGEERLEPNGAFVETLVGIIIDRLAFYEHTQFSCEENRTAIQHLRNALRTMHRRTRDRERRMVEGTHEK